MKNSLLVSLFVLLLFPNFGQEKLGISNSNYSSTNSIFLNPSSTVDSRAYMQLNLVGVNAYAMNNLVYIPGFTLARTITTGNIPDPQPANLNFKKFLMLVASAEAPAFVISKRNYGAGFFIRGRSVGELKKVPYQLTNLFLKLEENPTISYPFSLDLKNMRFSNMTWVEYGVNFGMMVKKRKNDLISVGGNVKYLTGINVAYGNILELKGAIQDSSIEVEKFSSKIRYNEPGWNTGKGFGVDLGFTYKKMLGLIDTYYANSRQSNCKYVDYKYKIGVSLRDVGAIRFKKNTTRAEASGSGFFSTYGNRTYEEQLRLDFNSSINNNPILAALPTALSVQFDWNFENHIYLNGTVVKNLIPSRVIGVQGSNLLSVCPRAEFKNFEVAMPLTFQKFMYPQLGFALRMRSLVFGVDNVFPLAIPKRTYGVGVYFNLGISLFRNPVCRKHMKRVDDCAPGTSLFKRAKKKESAPKKKKIRRKK